jgi:hypothetical protein
MEAGDSFFALSNFIRGKIDKYNLEYSDPLIQQVRVDRNSPAQSEVYLEFKNSETFFNSLGVSEDDAWFARAVNSSYNDFDFVDTYAAKDDFEQGYGVWYILDDENIDLLEKISKLIYPYEFDLDDNKFKSGLAEKLLKYYPDEIDSILRDYVYERNAEMQQDAKESINKEIENALNEISFEFVSYDTIKAKVGDLISLYYQYNVPHLPLGGLVKEIFGSKDFNLGGWDENRYEYGNSEYFDSDSINREVYRQFTKIYDSLTEDNNSESLKQFFEFFTRVTQKFKVGVWYDLPKSKDFMFKIVGPELDERKIKVSLKMKGSNKQIKDLNVSEDSLNRLLYQPELFDLSDI